MNSPQPPTLLYHKVDPNWEVGVTRVSPQQFKRQILSIHRSGWRTILPPSGSKFITTGDDSLSTTDSKSNREFMLVFDDGYESVYRYAFPMLESIGYKAMVFMPSGFIGKWNSWDHNLLGRRFKHLDINMLRELVAAGWKVGSHGISHYSFVNMTEEKLRTELRESKSDLEGLLGISIDRIAFPFGRYNTSIIRNAKEANYIGAVVPVENTSVVTGDFEIVEADSVYRWDTPESVLKLLNRSAGYKISRLARRVAHRLNKGTILWRSVLRSQITLA